MEILETEGVWSLKILIIVPGHIMRIIENPGLRPGRFRLRGTRGTDHDVRWALQAATDPQGGVYSLNMRAWE